MTERRQMTDRQRETLSFIRGYTRRHGHPPTLTEVAEGTGVANRTTPWTHVQALVRDGYLEPRPLHGSTAYWPVEEKAAA